MSYEQPRYLAQGAPGHTQILGEKIPNRAWTLVRFTDKSELLVHWDGRFEVSGVHNDGVVTVYCPDGRRLHFSRHIIDMIEHQECQDDQPDDGSPF